MAQRSTTTAFAKSTRPEISGVVQREALFARLDGTPARSVAWISAPPGFGKTTLAASYLEARGLRWAWYQVDPDDDDGETFLHYLAHAVRRLRTEGEALPVFGPEHRADVAGFARRYFRALFSGVAGPVALVLDNLHALTPESPLRALLEAGLPQVPRHSCVIVTSRVPPPPSLVHLQPGGQMVCLAADDLRLSAPELAEMARLRGRPLTPEAVAQLQQRADGWAAALVLLVEHLKLVEDAAQRPGETPPHAVFDYLAGEIFERFEPATRRLLLQVACLPRVTIEVARALSGDDAAGRVLFNLARNDYFVREVVGPDGRVFLFHPLLREFLLRSAARDLPEAIGAAALARAAALLREAGQPEEALTLYAQCKHWAEVAAIVAGQAELLLAQGRHATLAGWIELLPPALLGQDAVLLCALGAALAQVSPRAARRRFEEGFEVARAAGDVPAMQRCCLGVLDAVLGEFDDLAELDRWLTEFERCGAAPGAGGSLPAALLVARLWRDPAHASVAAVLQSRDAERTPRSALARSVATLLRGDFPRSAAIAGSIDADAVALRVAAAPVAALRQLMDGESAAALAAARGGLELGAAEAIRGQDTWLRLLCAAAALAHDEVDTARGTLADVATLALRRGDRACLHYLQAWLARSEGEPGVALREARSAALLAVEAGLPWLELLARLMVTQLLAAAGDRQGAEAQGRGVDALAERLASPLVRLAALFTQAFVAMAFDDDGAALAPLEAALALARELGVRHVVGVPPALLAGLCATALQRGIAVDHTRILISAGRLGPPAAALRLRQWPWAFQVTTLGGFGLRRGRDAIEFSAKGPGRPVELLKVLVALGGQNVRADQLADALWPHVDADYAHKSFTATLHRLRRIFGEDDTLRLSDGRLSLNPALFRVDTWALDHLLGELDAQLRVDTAGVRDELLGTLVDEALALYRGPFLPDEAEQPAYIARREQLRARLLRVLTRVARRWEDGGRSDAVIDCYLRCIDADELYEAFYRHLMLCHQRRGDTAEAHATYDRLSAVLAARLRSVPSAETQAIHASLRP